MNAYTAGSTDDEGVQAPRTGVCSDEQACAPDDAGADRAPDASGGDRVPLAGAESALVAQAVFSEILPRLMQSRLPDLPATPEAAPVGSDVSPEELVRFFGLMLDGAEVQMQAFVEGLSARGLGIHQLYPQLLVRMSEHLDMMWQRDYCTFTDVTIASGRLQRLARHIGALERRRSTLQDPTPGHRILLTPGAGEQHTLGLTMVAEYFHLAGWDVAFERIANGPDALARVRQEWFDVIGLTIGAEVAAPQTRRLIEAIRAASRNPQVRLIAGGPFFALRAGKGHDLDLDAVITDGSHAPAIALGLLSAV